MSKQEQAKNPETETPKRTRHGNGLLIFAVFAVIIFAINYKPAIDIVYCDTNTLTSKPEVIMLGASWCPYCYKARRYFVENNIHYCEYDIEDNGEGEQRYANMNTNPIMPLGIPVLFIGDYKFSGFDQRSVEKALSETKNRSN